MSNAETSGRSRSIDHLAAIVESSDDAIISTSFDGTILSWSAGAERMYGYTAAEAIGETVSMLVPAERPDELPRIFEQLRRGQPVDRLETVRVHKDGRRSDVSVTISPIVDAQGAVVGASSVARDLGERKASENHLRLLTDEHGRAVEALRRSDESYRRLTAMLLADGAYPALATHDEKMIESGLDYVQQYKIRPEQFEFQMLYGIRRDLQKRLVNQGYRLRLYVPYGVAWYPYFMRRLAERPANVLFLARNIIRS